MMSSHCFDGQRHPALSQWPYRLAAWIAVGLIAAIPLWGVGMVSTRGGGDSPFLLQRTMEMAEALRAGALPVSWMAHAAYDLGYPFFHHYAALPYYLSGGLVALGLGPIRAIQATQTFGFLAAAVAMGIWSRRLFRRDLSVMLAVAAYTFAPFHMVNVYVRGDSLSEFYAFVWYPLILAALDHANARPRDGWRMVFPAVAYAGLALTHNVSFLIFTPFALLYALLTCGFLHLASPAIAHLWLRLLWRYLRCLVPFAVGLLLSAWFWLPAIGDTRFGQMGPAFTEGYFHYKNHFRAANLVQTLPYFDYSTALQAQEAGAFAMGFVQALLAAAGLSALLWRLIHGRSALRQQGRTAAFLVGGLGLASFMITPLSAPLWAHLPLLSLTQFPWRFLSVQALFTAGLSGAFLETVTLGQADRGLARRWLPTGLGLVLVAWVAAASLGRLSPDRLRIVDEDVTWENLSIYEAFTGNIGTTIRYEYLPRDVVPRPYLSEALVTGEIAPLTSGDHGLQATLIERVPQRQVWDVSLSESATVAFPINWWPGWRAKVAPALDAAASVSPYPHLGSGRLALDLPAGHHRVTLWLSLTPLQGIGLVVSVLTLIVLGVGWGWRVLTSSRQILGDPAPCRIAGITLVAISGLSLLLPLFAAGSPRELSGQASFFDFVRMPYPHRGPVRYGNAALVAANLSAETVLPGETLEVSLGWEMAHSDPLTVEVRLVLPAEPRHGVNYTLARSVSRVMEETVVSLALPEDLSRGLYLVGINVYADGVRVEPQTQMGRALGSLYVGALRVPQGSRLVVSESPLAVFSEIALESAAAIQLDPTTLRLKLQWSTPGTARNWSLSIRLLDANGRLLVQQDGQPGYGYLPTTLWEPGGLVTDYPVLRLPEGLAPGQYTLRIVAYLEATMEVGGEVDVPIVLDQPVRYDLRDACCELTRKGQTILCALDGFALVGADFPDALQEGHDLEFWVEWNVTQVPVGNIAARWVVYGAADELLGSFEGPPAAGSSPSAWPVHTWVRVPVTVALPPVIPGRTLQVVLNLTDGAGGEVACRLPRPIEVSPRPRTFESPQLPNSEQARFGSEIGLLGYAVERQRDHVIVTLWWQAQAAPERDLKRFVHLFDPQTEHIVAQDDAMPRGWTYPTSWWIAGEVVSETVTLDIASAAKGTYRLAVGWYEPESLTRLPAYDAAGARLSADRVVLGQQLRLR